MPAQGDAQPAAGIPGSRLPGPYPVGRYAAALRDQLRGFKRVQLLGELVNLRAGGARMYFELRDGDGAIACSAWRDDWELMRRRAGEVTEGMQVVVAGGCDYYPGSATSSPAFHFAVGDVRIAGTGDLLARIDRLRKTLAAEGLLEPQKRLALPALPRSIGVVTGATGKARDDVLAGLHRRGWAGRLVWAFAPVQDRHAAPAITRALQDLAALGSVDVVIVARGGGSLADLLCFCDETLCRTVAMLPVPVIASVGHHTDRTLLDDVAAVSCSTPTHAAQAAVALDCADARAHLLRDARRLRAHASRAVIARADILVRQIRAPAAQVARERTRLHQSSRELRASSQRQLAVARQRTGRRLLVVARKHAAARLDVPRRARATANLAGDLRRAGTLRARRERLAGLAATLAAHDPQSTLQRGYAIVRDRQGELVTNAAAARLAGRFQIHFADGEVPAEVPRS